jgi:hypothetical protein
VRLFLPELELLFTQGSVDSRQMGLLELGTAALDGTKLYAAQGPRASPDCFR